MLLAMLESIIIEIYFPYNQIFEYLNQDRKRRRIWKKHILEACLLNKG